MPDALERRLLADAQSDHSEPPSFDAALDAAVGRRGRSTWLAVAAAVVLVGGVAAAGLAASGDDRPPADHPAGSSSHTENGRVALSANNGWVSTATNPRLVTFLVGLTPCHTSIEARATQTSSRITVRVTALPVNSAACRAATSSARPRSFAPQAELARLLLAAPLGDRPVIDALSGRTVGISDRSDNPLLRPVPSGYRPAMIDTTVYADVADENSVGVEYAWSDRHGNILQTRAGGRKQPPPGATVVGQVAGVPARAYPGTFQAGPGRPKPVKARCIVWRPAGKQPRNICATASAFDNAALLKLARDYR